MPKIKEELIEKFDKYIREFGDVLTTDGSVLFCRACNKVINRSFKKFSITQHFATQTHFEAVEKYNNNNKTQIQIIDCNSVKVKKEIETKVIKTNNHNINSMVRDLQINSLIGKRKDKLTLKQKINNYIREFGDVLTTDGNILFCRACNREITRAFKKYSVTQHFNTHTHIEAFKRYVDCGQQFIVCDQTPIKTEVNDQENQINNQNTFVIEEVNDNKFNLRSDDCSSGDNSLNNDLNCNLIQNDVKSHEKIVLLLETIKDKVKLLLIDCKCELNSSLKNEVKQLINQYECNYCQLNEERVDLRNENSVQIKAHLPREQSSSSAIDSNKEFVFGNELFASKAMNLEPIVANSSFIIAKNSSKPESQFEKHMNKVNNKKLKPFKCNKCGKCFSNKRAVKSHIIIFHRNYNNKFSNNSDTNNNLNFKKNIFIKNKKLMCDWPECSFQTKYNFEMKIHRISIHQNSAQKLNDSSQKSIAEDNKDIKQQVKQEILQFICQSSECGQQFSNKNDLRSHYISEHSVKQSIACERPGRQLSSNESVFETKHEKLVEKSFECLWSECKKQFLTGQRLKLHLMVRHRGEQPLFKCKFWPKCQMTFNVRNDLLTHYNTYHESDQ